MAAILRTAEPGRARSNELLHSERHDLLALFEPAGDQHVAGLKSRDRNGVQSGPSALADDPDGGTVALVVKRRERQPRDAVVGCPTYRHGGGHAELYFLAGILDGVAGEIGSGGGIG